MSANWRCPHHQQMTNGRGWSRAACLQPLDAEARGQLRAQPLAGAQPHGQQAALVVVQLELLNGATVVDLIICTYCSRVGNMPSFYIRLGSGLW